MIRTHEGAMQYEHSMDHTVEFFSKAGSLFEKREEFYEGGETALSLFKKSWIVDSELTFKLLLWLRDCRGGAGNRSGFRTCLKWLATYSPEWVRLNISWLPLVGRWDDLRTLFGTPVELDAARLWADAIIGNEVLAAKWADRSDRPLRLVMGLKTEKEFRQRLASIRMNHVVEHKMCTDKWGEITYEHVPSVAMARYTKAFGKHDEVGFNAYKEALKTGSKKVHAGVLFPHDCVRTVFGGDEDIANAQFDALPNYMAEDARAIVIADTTSSMSTKISGSVKSVHVSIGMALYCSSKLAKDNPFYKKFMSFSEEGHFKDWNGMSFSGAVCNREIFDGAVGSTYVACALDLILKTAKWFKLPDSMMPNMLLIVSDMQFHQANAEDWSKENNVDRLAEVELSLEGWKAAGYSIPKVVYWNTAGYAGSPGEVGDTNIALVSGFSPSVLKAIFEGEDFSPRAVMLRALDKYDIDVPK